jgi:hypothetical protein
MGADGQRRLALIAVLASGPVLYTVAEIVVQPTRAVKAARRK